jgi:hypothetical protein
MGKSLGEGFRGLGEAEREVDVPIHLPQLLLNYFVMKIGRRDFHRRNLKYPVDAGLDTKQRQCINHSVLDLQLTIVPPLLRRSTRSKKLNRSSKLGS